MYNASTMLVVQNLEKAKDFYIKKLGLRVTSEQLDRVHLTIGSHEIVIFQGNGPAVNSKHEVDANSSLIFWTKDLDKKIEELKSQGVEFINETPATNSWGRYSVFKDPSGIVHELFEIST